MEILLFADRAKMAETPEDSDFTSIQLRIRKVQLQTVAIPEEAEPPVPAEAPREQPPLMPLVNWFAVALADSDCGLFILCIKGVRPH